MQAVCGAQLPGAHRYTAALLPEIDRAIDPNVLMPSNAWHAASPHKTVWIRASLASQLQLLGSR